MTRAKRDMVTCPSFFIFHAKGHGGHNLGYDEKNQFVLSKDFDLIFEDGSQEKLSREGQPRFFFPVKNVHV